MFKIAEGVYTDSQESADLAVELTAYEAWEPRWNPIEGKWDL